VLLLGTGSPKMVVKQAALLRLKAAPMKVIVSCLMALLLHQTLPRCKLALGRESLLNQMVLLCQHTPCSHPVGPWVKLLEQVVLLHQKIPQLSPFPRWGMLE